MGSSAPIEGLLRSAVSLEPADGARTSLPAIQHWLSERAAAMPMDVERIRFDAMDAWHFDPSPHLRLVHDSGRFFSAHGARLESRGGVAHRPLLVQPEVGLLGFLMARFGEVPHVLVQAKREPGNRSAQLSPTVQATHSNYTRAHGGRGQPYLEHFLEPDARRVLDALMPEHGAYFLRKRNRNVVVEVSPDVPVAEGFLWVTLGQLKELLRRDDIVHMDTRSVIGCLPFEGDPTLAGNALGEFGAAAVRSAADANDVDAVVKWLRAVHDDTRADVTLVGLDELPGWTLTPDALVPAAPDERASLVAVRVEAAHREVPSWTQPMLRIGGEGLAGLLCRRDGGVLRFLVQARAEPGGEGTAHVFPTVTSAAPGPFEEWFRAPRPERVRYAAKQSEEGGRFLGFDDRVVVVELSEDEGVALPPLHRWMTLGQLLELGKRGVVSIELRNVLAALPLR